ncbi:MAG TPA: WHG domain-containing protein [Bacillus sp. (in: firmicutes)]|uniref:TetR/AcrR family transcriptional regulator n=1 Tax=Bacillus litorisediminis TaxID=2922713 RepID=UPI001FADBD00|nr:TetR/AcrR family transcriptional regulator [Bacillus litorisediminis]HWO77087.1 WHG domain-containing protein [Bacillus sp. (in: firmicutes)]
MSPRRGLDLKVILETAAEIANTEGVEAITLAALAKKLHIKPPSLYNHIDGLSGLQSKLAVFGLEQLLKELTKASVGRAGDEAVQSLAEAYVSFARKQPGLYQLTLKAPKEEDTDYHAVANELVELLFGIFRAYHLNDEAAIHAVRGIRSILHGYTTLEQKGGFGLSIDLDVSLRFMIDTFLAGIKSANRK